MSPEQASGDHARVGPASDVYGLGATLYCVLVGQAPFPEGDVGTVLERVRRGVFPAPRRVRRSIDPALEAICLKAMAREPGDRHGSPLELAREIEAWLADVRYRGEQARALNQARRSLARLGLERAHGLFERGRPAEGMLWLARALEDAPPDDPTLGRALRASLAGWHVGARSLERGLRHQGEVVAVAIDPEGRRLAACSGEAARLWDVSTGAPLTPPLRHEGPVRAVAFRPDGRVVVTAGDDGALRRWDALTGEPVGGPVALGDPAVALEFDAGGTRVLATSGSGAPQLRDAGSGEPVPWPTWLGRSVLALAFGPDGGHLAAACDDGLVSLWSAPDGGPIGGPIRPESAVLCLSFGPVGPSPTLLVGCIDGKARLWDALRGILLVEFDHRAEVVRARSRPGGGAVATLGRDGTARLWDPATGEPLGEPLSQPGGIADLAFSPDGEAVATRGLDGNARLWDAATALPVGPPLEHKGAVTAMAFSPDGRRLATGCADGLARCWKVPPPLAGDAGRIACWARVETGLEFDAGDAIRPIGPLAAWEARRLLIELGGPPIK